MILIKRYVNYYNNVFLKSQDKLSNEEILNVVSRTFAVHPEDVYNPIDGNKHNMVTVRGVFLYVVFELYKTKLVGMFNYKRSEVNDRIRTIENLMEVDKDLKYTVNEIIKILIKIENY